MDFALTEDQASLRDLAAQILSDNSNDDSLRAFAKDDRPYDAALWQTLAEAGLLGVAVPEAHGGLGQGMIELGLLLEEQGRTLAPLPLHATLVTGALPIAAFGSAAQQAILPRVAAGKAILTAALEEVGNHDPARPMLRATRSGNGWTLDGVKTAVPYGAEAECILVPATSAKGVIVFLIDPATPGIEIGAQRTTSSEPQAQITFRAAQADDVLGSAAQGADIARWIVDHARAGLAALQVGICAEALRRTAAYSSERIQFDRPLGGMQAVQHRVADGFIDVEAMRSTALRAAWLLDEGIAAPAEIETAKYWAAIGGHRVSHSAQHLHGGIGADMDYPIHRYFLAAKQVELALGGAQPMLAAIGRAIAAGDTQPLAGARA
ncbi:MULTISPECIES: acyl-CoA dehydrogenase family protein [unclassified Sphingomonas]|uniref:acyl-CoA dehydrogenase family protein n=1 Tax=unclassified Sphingomonas TaxID=196159 RepID=UPI00092943CA|nr:MULTISPECIES: acyl-CoA dehydrogenase family protein [unclassified Sphingomonas]OJU18973.1 MAG: acyl-CoA dehydrogenase [Sphingomonas sp. 66-10]